MDKKIRYVLLVDDEQNITNALQRELYDWAAVRSLEIMTAPSARKGLEMLQKQGEGYRHRGIGPQDAGDEGLGFSS